MKLAARYQRSYLITTLLVFIGASVAFYVLLHRVLLLQMDEELEIEQREIETYVSRFRNLPQNVLPVEDQIVRYERTRRPQLNCTIATRRVWNPATHTEEDFRQLQFSLVAGNNWYRVTVSKSLEATQRLTRQIGLIAISISALLLLLLFSMNRIVLGRLWKPFYRTIGQLSRFGVEAGQGLRLPPVKTEEFNLLNSTLTAVSERAAQDYALLKEFTENAAHELQTPLAIVRAKLDLLIQEEGFSGTQSKLVQAAYQALARMTHLNQSLLELAKIEGGQYHTNNTVDLKLLLTEKLDALDELLQNKGLTLSGTLDAGLVRMNPVLADLLLNNLLTNAIRHNQPAGQIHLTLHAGYLSVCNTSAQPALKPELVFSRFAKTEGTTSGTGLGLAISRQICIASGCRIDYHYAEGMHCFTVTWEVPERI